MSRVITKHLCNYRNRFYKSFYRVILTTVFFRIFRLKTNFVGDFKENIDFSNDQIIGTWVSVNNILFRNIYNNLYMTSQIQ